MIGLLAMALSTCVVPEGHVVAQAEYRGQAVVAREGAIEIGARQVTVCDGLPGPFPTALAVTDDGLFVGFRAAGVHRFDGVRFVRVEGAPKGAVHALAAWRSSVLVGTASGLFRVRAGRVQRVKHRVLGRRGISALAVDRKGALHVGAGAYGWWRIKRPGARPVRLRRGFVGCFSGAQRPKAEVGGAVCDLGVARRASGLPSGHITAVAVHEGALYVGMFDGGLAKRDGARFVPVLGAPRFVNALLSVDDSLWIAGARGLWWLDTNGRVHRAAIKLPSDHVSALAAGPVNGQPGVWVGTSRGVVGFGPGGVRHLGIDQGLPAPIVYAVAVTDDGAVWAGTAGGAVRFGREGTQTFSQASGALPHDWVNALVADGDEVLAGTYDAGVVRLSADGSGRPMVGAEGAWVNPAGVASLGDGRWTIATLGGGLLVADAHGAALVEGLPANDVTAARTFEGAMWVGTRGGLARLGLAP